MDKSKAKEPLQAPEDYPYEQFPRGELPMGIQRRRFLSAMMAEVHIQSKQSTGHVGRRLPDLGRWTDEDLYCVAPVLVPGSKIELQENFVCGTPPGGRPLMMFPASSPALIVFNLFDGINTLVEIADTLTVQTGWPEEKSFAYTRGVFLSLVTVGLCQPKWS